MSTQVSSHVTRCDWNDCPKSALWFDRMPVVLRLEGNTDDVVPPPGAWMQASNPSDTLDDFCPEHAAIVGPRPWARYWVPAAARP